MLHRYLLEPMGSTMQVFRPTENIVAFYDGRVPGARVHALHENWMDDGAFVLGICSYAIVEGDSAIVYDTHLSLAHARLVRSTLQQLGVHKMVVVVSHWHRDHIVGLPVFEDCEIISNEITRDLLIDNRDRLMIGDPAIPKVVLPTRTFRDTLDLQVGSVPVTLRHVDIHSTDGTVALLPETGVLLAGDTLEDSATYIGEHHRLETHLAGLREMATWPIHRILPNHGSADVIAAGGYRPELIGATIRYIEKLLYASPELCASQDLRVFASTEFDSGVLIYHEEYESVHRRNVAGVLQARAARDEMGSQ